VSSQTKSNILKQHQANSELNTSLLPQSMRNDFDLSADEIIYPLNEQIIAGSSEAMESGQTHYVDVPGIGPLREALAEYLNSETDTQYQKENILVTAGAQEARFLTIQKIGELFDSIAVPQVVHPGVLKALGVRPRNIVSIPVNVSQSALPSIDSISKAIESGIRLLYLESPSRLTGEVYSSDDVDQIGDLALKNDVAIIWDQGLASWVAGTTYSSIASKDTETKQIATIGEAWSGMGLANWFIGYIAAPVKWIAPMQSQKQIMAICTSTAAQYAALEASKLFAEVRSQQLEQLKNQKDALIKVANDAGLTVIDSETVNILAIKLSTNDKVSSIKALKEAGFDVADGTDFGAPNVIRLNVTSVTEQAIKKIN